MLFTEVSLHVDYADELMLSEELYDEKKIAALLKTASLRGIKTINWRVNGCGGALYPSKVELTSDHFSEEEARNPPENWVYPSNKEVHISHFKKWADNMRIVLSRFDPIEIASKLARENNLGFNLYFCPFDQYWPGRTGEILKKYPYACWRSRDGKKTLPGMVSLAYPEAREFYQLQCEELLQYDFDNLYIYLGCHGWYGFPESPDEDYFGYEEPVVEEYKKRYGANITRTQDFDRLAWHKLKGEYFTLFLKELHTLLIAKQRGLIVGKMLGDYNLYYRWAPPRQCVARYYLDWKQWTQWKNVTLAVGDQSDIWTHSLWQSHPDMPGTVEKFPYEYLDDYYGNGEERNFPLLVFRALHAGQIETELGTVRDNWNHFSADGLILREAAGFEFEGGNWDMLKILEQD